MIQPPQYQWPQGPRHGAEKEPKQIGQQSSVGGPSRTVKLFPSLSETNKLPVVDAECVPDSSISVSQVDEPTMKLPPDDENGDES